ncbi:ATP-binding protein [Streptomyces sp. NPDC046866]|uniref:ATP-binding protein n=1 Tax=Streptomyces sp. NPDC046866 TaxID=3154921 RepID=UPI003454AA2A
MTEHIRRLNLEGATAGVVSRCREFTRRALADWRWIAQAEPEPGALRPGPPRSPEPDCPDCPDAVEDVLLMVSEMVSNACLHAGGPREFVLRLARGGLRMEVGDGSPEPPRRRTPADPALPGGHGLLVLERLARSWGWEPYADGRPGKTVWAEVPSPLTPDGCTALGERL